MLKTATPGPMAAAQPKKLFYRINEVAKLTGVKPYVLRYWESEFPELAPEKDGSDQRRYRVADIRTVQAIRKLLYEERFTIKGARSKLKQTIRDFSRIEGGGLPKGDPAALREAAAALRKEVRELLDLLR